MNRPLTIQFFLPLGDPRGMRVAEITTRIVRVIEVPRSQWVSCPRLACHAPVLVSPAVWASIYS
jgi:hypothetical protein